MLLTEVLNDRNRIQQTHQSKIITIKQLREKKRTDNSLSFFFLFFLNRSEPAHDPTTSLYPMHTPTPPLQPPPQQQPVLKSICISTKTEGPVMQATHRPLTSYENINGLLNSVHIERFGDPEVRESWWQQQDIEMTDDNSNTEYSSMNSVLRQAFLHRRQS
ncbi:MAG: hypothetical protein JSY10_27125 [Paenibacillus sp.]|nr:hypothetical protein [Paenibacillus sp.]